MGARAAVLGSRAGAGSGAGRCPRPGALDPAAWGCLGLGSSEGQELSRGQGSQGPLAALQSAGRGRPGPSERRPGHQGRCSGCTRTRAARARNASAGFRRGTWAPPAPPGASPVPARAAQGAQRPQAPARAPPRSPRLCCSGRRDPGAGRRAGRARRRWGCPAARSWAGRAAKLVPQG